MDNQNQRSPYQKMGQTIACGRTLDEQINDIDQYGGHGCANTLRLATLAAHGIPKPRTTAEYCFLFGCYRPFNTPYFIRDSVRILEPFGVDYTYLDKEYCCGAPLLMSAPEDERDQAWASGKSFIGQNMAAAEQKGAQKMVYGCTGCLHAALAAYPETKAQHIYVLDLILDHLGDRPLKVPPTVVGYFEGCHTFNRKYYHGNTLNWPRYRQILDRIEGVTVVDIPNNMCCKSSSSAIVENAKKLQADNIVVSCSGCYFPVLQASAGKIPVLTLSELLLQGLE